MAALRNGLKFESDAEIGQKGHLWMGTNYNPNYSGSNF
jgi:hypothetical protein